MSKRCPHCDGEIRPSVLKCLHCGKNVNDPPDVAPADEASPVAAAVEAALDPTAPPTGVAFTPPVAVVPMQSPPTQPTSAAAGAVPPVARDISAPDVQDWGSPTPSTTGADPYWQVKRVPPVSPGGAPPEAAAKKKADPKSVVAAILLLSGGVVAMAASLQPWITSSGNCLKEVLSDSRRGFAGWEGKLTVVLGVACVILGLLSFVRRDAGPLKGGLVAGLGMVAVGFYTMLTASSSVVAELVAKYEVTGMRQDAARGLVAGCLDSGSFKTSPEMWLYAVIAAGVAAFIGGLLAFSVRPAPHTDPLSSSPPTG